MSNHQVQVCGKAAEHVVVRTGVREFVPDGAPGLDDPRYADALRESNARNLALRKQLEDLEFEVGYLLGKLRMFLRSRAVATPEGEVVIRYRAGDIVADKLTDSPLPLATELAAKETT